MRNLLTARGACLGSVLALLAVLAGCGGADGSNASASPAATAAAVSATAPQTPPSSAAPQISGSPATTVEVGQSYSFQPSATDAGNAVLTFTLSGAPDWMTFNPATGHISGTPTSADVGTDAAIVLHVSNGTSAASLAPFAITVVAAGSSSGNISLSWQVPTKNTDGSALVNLGGFAIHYGTASKIYTSTITLTNPGLTSYVVDDLPPGTYYFSMTATTTSGEQSGPSQEASTTIS
jgi:Putative Ig domain